MFDVQNMSSNQKGICRVMTEFDQESRLLAIKKGFQDFAGRRACWENVLQRNKIYADAYISGNGQEGWQASHSSDRILHLAQWKHSFMQSSGTFRKTSTREICGRFLVNLLNWEGSRVFIIDIGPKYK